MADADAAGEVLALVNSARTDAGCSALTVDAVLAETAIAHSTAMRDQATLRPPPGRGTVTAGGADPAAVAAEWLADRGGKLTECSATSAGVGVVDGWWTLLTD